jgi:hypothetical protein
VPMSARYKTTIKIVAARTRFAIVLSLPKTPLGGSLEGGASGIVSNMGGAVDVSEAMDVISDFRDETRSVIVLLDSEGISVGTAVGKGTVVKSVTVTKTMLPAVDILRLCVVEGMGCGLYVFSERIMHSNQ